MVKITILFHQPTNVEVFEIGYNQTLALLERLPGLKRRQVAMVFGSPSGKSPYYRLLELYFEDSEALDSALRSQEGQIAGASLMNFAGKTSELLFADVYED